MSFVNCCCDRSRRFGRALSISETVSFVFLLFFYIFNFNNRTVTRLFRLLCILAHGTLREVDPYCKATKVTRWEEECVIFLCK